VALSQQVFRRIAGQDVNWVGPDHSDHALRITCFVLEHSVMLAHTAVISLLHDYGTAQENKQFRPRLEGIMADWRSLPGRVRAGRPTTHFRVNGGPGAGDDGGDAVVRHYLGAGRKHKTRVAN
jgi:hypothetical protein